MKKVQRTVYLPQSIIDEIQKTASNLGYSFNDILIMLLRDYYYDERVKMVHFLKGEK